MLRKLHRNRKGQNTAEYAILISLVVAAIISMQIYLQRSFKARWRDAAAVYLMDGTANLTGGKAATMQYEPYYLSSQYNVERKSQDTIRLDNGLAGKFGSSNQIRQSDGYQFQDFDPAAHGQSSLSNGV